MFLYTYILNNQLSVDIWAHSSILLLKYSCTINWFLCCISFIGMLNEFPIFDNCDTLWRDNRFLSWNLLTWWLCNISLLYLVCIFDMMYLGGIAIYKYLICSLGITYKVLIDYQNFHQFRSISKWSSLVLLVRYLSDKVLIFIVDHLLISAVTVKVLKFLWCPCCWMNHFNWFCDSRDKFLMKFISIKISGWFSIEVQFWFKQSSNNKVL